MPIDDGGLRARGDRGARPAGEDRLGQPVALQRRAAQVQRRRASATRKIAAVRALPGARLAARARRRASAASSSTASSSPQEAVGEALFAKVQARQLQRRRASWRSKLKLTGPLALPKGLELDADLRRRRHGAQRVRCAGPRRWSPSSRRRARRARGRLSAATFTLPFAPEVSLGQLRHEGHATPQRHEHRGLGRRGPRRRAVRHRQHALGRHLEGRRRGHRARHQRRGVRAGAALRGQGRGQRQVLDERRRSGEARATRRASRAASP